MPLVVLVLVGVLLLVLRQLFVTLPTVSVRGGAVSGPNVVVVCANVISNDSTSVVLLVLSLPRAHWWPCRRPPAWPACASCVASPTTTRTTAARGRPKRRAGAYLLTTSQRPARADN